MTTRIYLVYLQILGNDYIPKRTVLVAEAI